MPPPNFSIFDHLKQKGYGEYIAQAKNGEVVHMPDIYYNPHDISPDLPDMPRWIRAIIFPLNDSAGKPERYVLMHENITERKLAEQEIASLHTSLKLALIASKSGTWDWDIANGTFFWSEEFREVFGMSPHTVAGFEAWKLSLHTDDVEIASKKIQEAIENKTELENDYRILLPNKEIRWIRATGKTFYDGDQPIRMAGLCTDITDRKRAEQQLQQASENWSKTFDAIQDGIILLDQSQIVMASNQAFLDFVGKTKEQVIGSHCYEMVHGTNCPHEKCPYEKLSWSRKRETTEMELNGIPCQVMVDPIMDSEKNIIGAVHIITDISQRKKAEKAVQDKVVELQRFFDVTVGRELKMIELKQEINDLARQLGEQEDRYIIVD